MLSSQYCTRSAMSALPVSKWIGACVTRSLEKYRGVLASQRGNARGSPIAARILYARQDGLDKLELVRRAAAKGAPAGLTVAPDLRSR
jgi:hypothetical protein